MSDYDSALDEALDEAIEDQPRDIDTMLTPMEATTATPRALMVRKLTDIVALPATRISSNERAICADILLQVIATVEEPLRKELAERASRVPECPPALLRMLLLDDPSVSQVVMQTAEQIPEALLIEAAQSGTMAHRTQIASRQGLTSAVADACLDHDEIDVSRAVLRREECYLSPNAVNKLVALSATNAEVLALLLRRRELEPAHGFMMFWWADKEQRKRIITRFAVDRRIIQDVLDDLYPRVFRGGEDDQFVREILTLCERRHRPRGANGEAVSQDVMRRTLAASLKYPSQELVDAVSMIGNVSRVLAGRILRDPAGEPFAVLCKSLGVSRDDFYDFYSDRESTELGDHLLEIFDIMARDYARAMLRYWDWEGNPRIAHITRLLEFAAGPIEDDPAF